MAADDNKPTWFERIQTILTSHWFRGILGCTTGIGILLLTLLTGGLPLAAMIVIGSVSTLLTLALGARSYYDAWQNLRNNRKLNMDALFAISTITVLIVSITAFFIPWLPMMFESGLLIYGFRHIGIAIKRGIREKADTKGFFSTSPQKVRCIFDGEEEEVDLDQIAVNDLLIIEQNTMLPVDCYCTEDCWIDEKIRTGRITPRLFRKGEQVCAGMWLRDTTKTFVASQTAEDSYLAQLDERIETAIKNKAPLEEISTRILTYFIPAILATAVVSGAIISLFFPPALAIQFAILVLLSACPCTLGLIVSLAVKAGMHKAATCGVLFNTSKALQDAEQIDTIVFDINGTLTQGKPRVTRCLIHEDHSQDRVFSLSAALERETFHPIGAAIADYVGDDEQDLTVETRGDQPHTGVVKYINNRRYLLGSSALMHDYQIDLSAMKNIPMQAGDSLVFLAEDDQLLAGFVITDPLRHEAKYTIDTLKKQGKTICLSTGADEATARRYATALGIAWDPEKIKYQQTPENKETYIRQLQQAGSKVAMIGDGGNDLNASAASDFSIALCSLEAPNAFEKRAKKAAGASITSESLLPVATAFAISRQTVDNIKLNLSISFGYNLCAYLIPAILLFTIGFTLNPALGVVFMVLQACFIFALVYHLKQQPVEHLEKLSVEEPAQHSHQRMNQLMPQCISGDSLQPVDHYAFIAVPEKQENDLQMSSPIHVLS